MDPSTLSGFTCANPIIIDESFDANYKLFKNQKVEVFAGYIGTNCRNGPPLKKIWVPKSYLENLQLNVIMHHLGRRQSPDLRLHMAQRLHTDRGPHMVTLTPMFCRETILRLMNMSVCLQTAMFIELRTFLLIHMSIMLLLQGYLLGLQSQNSQMLHSDSLFRSHP